MLTNQKPTLDIDKMQNFQQWKQANDSDFSLFDYLGVTADVEIVLALTQLLCPELIEYRGGSFLKLTFDEAMCWQWQAKLDDITEVEKVMNHLHLDDLFPGTENVGVDNLYYLGQTLKQIWELYLPSVYPEKQFQVICNVDKEAETVVLTLFNCRAVKKTAQRQELTPVPNVKEDSDRVISSSEH